MFYNVNSFYGIILQIQYIQETLYNPKGGTLRAIPAWEINRQYILL